MPVEPRLPTCPHCGTNDRVEQIEPHLAAGWPWLCAGCNSVFTGTDEEFARLGPARQKRRDQARTAPRRSA